MTYPLAAFLFYGGFVTLLVGYARLIQLRSRCYPRERWLAVVFPVLLVHFLWRHWAMAKPAFWICCGGLLATLAGLVLIFRAMKET